MRLIPLLKQLAQETIQDCTFRKEVAMESGLNQIDLLLPSGDEKYKSFWVRDAAMMAESLLVDSANLKQYIELIATCGQNGRETLYLDNGLKVPPYAVADHINYNGRPVFFPGTMNDGTDQGIGKYGFYPPFCDNFYFVIMVGAYVRQTGNRQLLHQVYKEIPLINRLEYAVQSYNIHPETQLCFSEEDYFTVDWGFVDAVKKSGFLAFASLLRYRAYMVLSELNPEQKMIYTKQATQIQSSLMNLLYDREAGLFYSATGIGHQHDVWATAYALCIGALKDERAAKALTALYEKGVVTTLGSYVRHVIKTEDVSDTCTWESTFLRYNSYQNGGYWATPIGWYARALYDYNPTIGEAFLQAFIDHTDAHREEGAPYEWLHPETGVTDGHRYGTSGVLPYVAFMDLI